LQDSAAALDDVENQAAELDSRLRSDETLPEADSRELQVEVSGARTRLILAQTAAERTWTVAKRSVADRQREARKISDVEKPLAIEKEVAEVVGVSEGHSVPQISSEATKSSDEEEETGELPEQEMKLTEESEGDVEKVEDDVNVGGPSSLAEGDVARDPDLERDGNREQTANSSAAEPFKDAQDQAEEVCVEVDSSRTPDNQGLERSFPEVEHETQEDEQSAADEKDPQRQSEERKMPNETVEIEASVEDVSVETCESTHGQAAEESGNDFVATQGDSEVEHETEEDERSAMDEKDPQRQSEERKTPNETVEIEASVEDVSVETCESTHGQAAEESGNNFVATQGDSEVEHETEEDERSAMDEKDPQRQSEERKTPNETVEIEASVEDVSVETCESTHGQAAEESGNDFVATQGDSEVEHETEEDEQSAVDEKDPKMQSEEWKKPNETVEIEASVEDVSVETC